MAGDSTGKLDGTDDILEDGARSDSPEPPAQAEERLPPREQGETALEYYNRLAMYPAARKKIDHAMPGIRSKLMVFSKKVAKRYRYNPALREKVIHAHARMLMMKVLGIEPDPE